MTATRVAVPTLFDGGWDSVLVCTYGADLAFFEHDLWRQIHLARHRIVFADRRQVRRQLRNAAGAAKPRYLNRQYVLAEVESDRAAHAKLILLLRPDGGRLAVGSGNLSLSGYTSQAECFTTYSWSEEHDAHLGEFLAARRFLDGLVAAGTVDPLVRPRLQRVWQAAPWLYREAPAAPPAVRHNLAKSLLDQFVELIGGTRVEELIVHAPFYDHECAALGAMIARLDPDRVTVLLQQKLTSVDPHRLEQVLTSARGRVEVRSAKAEETGAVLHAKFFVARCGDIEYCMQGSPNLSTPALQRAHPAGNIELANLLHGPRGCFDHLVDDLVISPGAVQIASLGLELRTHEAEVEEATTPVRSLKWAPPQISGVFGRSVDDPPQVFAGDTELVVTAWRLDATEDGTAFETIVDEAGAEAIDRVEALTFVFADGPSSEPSFPHHVRHLDAMSAGHMRAELLSKVGDLDLGDEELEDLLAEFDAVLIIDGRSVWRLAGRKEPPVADGEDDEMSTISYEDLDWDAIQSHPQLAQYRDWDGTGPADDLSAVEILLSSITSRFQRELDRRRSGNGPLPGVPDAPGDDADVDLEDEDAAADREQRRLAARARVRRRCHAFLRRVVKGLADDEFVRGVGPGVLVKSYIYFNHICWRFLVNDLADLEVLVAAQVDLWRFFWGDEVTTGYFASLTGPEQVRAHELLRVHHATTVLLCAVAGATGACARRDLHEELLAVRDRWRAVLTNPFWSPDTVAVEDAWTMTNEVYPSAERLVDALGDLAAATEPDETRSVVAALAGMPDSRVDTTSVTVKRQGYGEVTVDGVWVLDRSEPVLDVARASAIVAALRSALPASQTDYLRLEQPLASVVAIADFEAGLFLLANKRTDDVELFAEPLPALRPWDGGIASLRTLACSA